MTLPTRNGEYLFYFEEEDYYALYEVVILENGEPYLIGDVLGEPTHWWHLPKPGNPYIIGNKNLDQDMGDVTPCLYDKWLNYTKHADDGNGNDITTGLRLKTFDEWLNA